MKMQYNVCYNIANIVSTTLMGGCVNKSPDKGKIEDKVKRESEQVTWSLFNNRGQRKYLTKGEIDAFINATNEFSLETKAFCWVMVYSGCRVSEALSLTADSIDFETRQLVIQSLKKRGKQIFRAVPLPPHCLQMLTRWIASREGGQARLWSWSRMTAYRRICEVMGAAGVTGGYASPKGLRHAFGIRAIQSNVPLTLVQRWLGHADVKTTAIYTSAMGEEERAIAARMWRSKRVWDEERARSTAPAPKRRRASRPRLSTMQA